MWDVAAGADLAPAVADGRLQYCGNGLGPEATVSVGKAERNVGYVTKGVEALSRLAFRDDDVRYGEGKGGSNTQPRNAQFERAARVYTGLYPPIRIAILLVSAFAWLARADRKHARQVSCNSGTPSKTGPETESGGRLHPLHSTRYAHWSRLLAVPRPLCAPFNLL